MDSIALFRNGITGKYEVVEQNDGACEVPSHYKHIGFYVSNDLKKSNQDLERENNSLKEQYKRVDCLIKKFNQLEKEKELLQNKFDFLMTLYKGVINELRGTGTK